MMKVVAAFVRDGKSCTTIYAKVANVGSGYTYAKQFADKLRPEGGVGEPENRYGTNSGAFDQLGWATLMLYRE